MVRRLDARAQGFAADYAALIGARGAHVDAAADAARAVIDEVRRDGIAALLRL
ncbi:MAG: histidinol dehydrogenase, partial [Alphaproteobacteria bacterium]|nr:histidinol dehydrogenase [Alphaproteobacteria bacterium]